LVYQHLKEEHAKKKKANTLQDAGKHLVDMVADAFNGPMAMSPSFFESKGTPDLDNVVKHKKNSIEKLQGKVQTGSSKGNGQMQRIEVDPVPQKSGTLTKVDRKESVSPIQAEKPKDTPRKSSESLRHSEQKGSPTLRNDSSSPIKYDKSPSPTPLFLSSNEKRSNPHIVNHPNEHRQSDPPKIQSANPQIIEKPSTYRQSSPPAFQTLKNAEKIIPKTEEENQLEDDIPDDVSDCSDYYYFDDDEDLLFTDLLQGQLSSSELNPKASSLIHLANRSEESKSNEGVQLEKLNDGLTKRKSKPDLKVEIPVQVERLPTLKTPRRAAASSARTPMTGATTASSMPSALYDPKVRAQIFNAKEYKVRFT
jgi:hypothetical protein